MVTRPTFFVAREMNPSTDEPSGKNDSSPKKETPEAGTEDIGADKSEDAEEDPDECPITEQFFRSDVDDLLDTPNENQPLEFASFSDDFDIVETTNGASAIPVDIDDIIQETNVTLSRIDTEEKQRSASRKRGGKVKSATSQRLASTAVMAEKKKSEGPSVTSPSSPVAKQPPHASDRASAKDKTSGKASTDPSRAPVATSTAVTRGPRSHAKPAPARSGRDANPKEQPSGANSLNQSPAPSLRSLAPNQRSAHKPTHYQGPVSDYFSPDTTQTPPSLASLMSPVTGGLVPQVSHTNGHRTSPVAPSTRRRSSATASHHGRDSNGRRRSLRRQSRDGEESLSTTDSGDSDDFYANSRHRRRSRSSHSRHRRRRSKDRGSRRRHSIDRRGSTHQERDPSVGSFIAHPYAGYLQAPAYQLVAAYPGAPVYPQAPAYPQGPQQAPPALRPAAYRGPQAFAPAPVQSLVYERPPEYLKSRGYADASAPLPPSGYAPIPEFQPYGSGRVSFAPGPAPSWNTNTQRRMPAPVTAPPRPRDWHQWQSGFFESRYGQLCKKGSLSVLFSHYVQCEIDEILQRLFLDTVKILTCTAVYFDFPLCDISCRST
ncbi:hypothetical protein HPB51_013881 [Rhipicephalus microplus]|uniref:Uncharacterized protein n=1 Tax=Rhipicephalus microplus TaxID=6941 RepID=A0A9J6DGX0_RHIMP|nr:hypothetical protein HPB51_013881 [Rhipicephalus microplus]